MSGGRLRKRASQAWPALAALVLLPACGHTGDPRPPLRRTPPAPTEFRLAQRGEQLLLEATAPAASIDGVPYDTVTVEVLHGTGQVDLTRAGRRETVHVAGGARAVVTLPLPAPGTLVRAAARVARGSERSPRTLTMALVAQAPIEAPRELAATLTGGGIDLGWLGARPQAVAPLPAPRLPGGPPARPGAPTGSNAAPAAATLPVPATPTTATPAPPSPAPPTSPSASASAVTPPSGSPVPGPGGVTAGATAGGGAPAAGATTPGGAAATQAGTAGPRRNGFSVYRRDGGGAYGIPLGPEPLDRRSFSDQGAPFGAVSCYVVRAVASTDPLIESASSNEVCLERRDITPPETPAGLAVLPRPDGLELLWSPSTEEDLAGYRVYRAIGAGEPEKLAEIVPGTASYLDTKVQKGAAYRYTLTAFDRAGNESPPCEPVEATLP